MVATRRPTFVKALLVSFDMQDRQTPARMAAADHDVCQCLAEFTDVKIVMYFLHILLVRFRFLHQFGEVEIDILQCPQKKQQTYH